MSKQIRVSKIFVAIPSHDHCPITFAYDLAALSAYTVAALPEQVPYGVNLVSGTYVHAARQQLAEEALRQGASHILWLDSDMRFPKEALVRLLQHDKDVVGINYAKRGIPPGFVGIKQIGDDEDVGSKLETNADSEGLESVGALGFGCLLMKTDVLKAMPDGEPWFWFDFLPKRRQMVGEDVYFFRLVHDAGFEVFCDHDLSKECGHTGEMTYRVQHLWSDEEVAECVAAP